MKTKKKVIQHILTDCVPSAKSVWFQAEDWSDDYYNPTEVTISIEDWESLGRPTSITVTING